MSSGSSVDASAGSSSSAGRPSGTRPKTPQELAEDAYLDCLAQGGPCVFIDSFTATAAAPVTVADIATFRPASVTQSMEPAGWAVTGLDTNFFAAASVHEVSGTLLGQPAIVRFTPVGYLWDYGDGASARRSTGGGSWSTLGVREFDRTPTSHVYTRAGDYNVTLSIQYRAEYRYAGSPGFSPVLGTLSIPTNPLTITAGSAATVLVDRNCLDHPAGPGC